MDFVMSQLSPVHSAPNDWPGRRLPLDSKKMVENGDADRPAGGHSHGRLYSPAFLGQHQFSAVMFAFSSLSLLCAVSYWPEEFSSELHMLRGSFLTIFIVYLFLLNILGWRIGGVDYVKMFELESDGAVWNTVCGVSMQTGVLWSSGALVTIALGLSNWNSAVTYIPLVLWLILICYFLWPLKTYFYDARVWMLNVLYRILVSPLYPVSFADFWVADQLNSLAIVLLDFEYSACFLYRLGSHSVADMKEMSLCSDAAWAPRQILACLPAWWRFAQCLRCYYDTKGIAHLLNAGKYFSTFPMIVTSALLANAQVEHSSDWRSRPEFWIWFACTFGRAIYVFVWDVVMDWGFFQPPHNSWKSKSPFLRTHLLFPVLWVYYGMMVVDLILRFIFLVKWSPTLSSLLSPPIFATVLASLEVLRRFLWNFFRLEYEQTKKIPESRASKPRPHQEPSPSPFANTHEL